MVNVNIWYDSILKLEHRNVHYMSWILDINWWWDKEVSDTIIWVHCSTLLLATHQTEGDSGSATVLASWKQQLYKLRPWIQWCDHYLLISSSFTLGVQFWDLQNLSYLLQHWGCIIPWSDIVTLTQKWREPDQPWCNVSTWSDLNKTWEILFCWEYDYVVFSYFHLFYHTKEQKYYNSIRSTIQ